MDKIDYKQVAQNILTLTEKNADKKSIECYVKWELHQPMIFWWNYKAVCRAMKLLGLPEPTEEKWKKR